MTYAPVSGIYRITNVVTKDYYVGSSQDVHKRWKDHRNLLRKNKHVNGRIQNAWNKYGESAFKFTLQLSCCVADLLVEEQRLLNLGLPPYNLSSCCEAPTRGLSPSEETRAKISASLRGRVRSPEHRAAISASGRGRQASASTRRRQSAAHQGVPRGTPTQLTRDKLRLATKAWLASPEGRAKHSKNTAAAHAANRGRIQSSEEVERRISPLRGRKAPADLVARRAASRRRPIFAEFFDGTIRAFTGKAEAALAGFSGSSVWRAIKYGVPYRNALWYRDERGSRIELGKRLSMVDGR